MADEVKPITAEEVEAFVARCQEVINAYYNVEHSTLSPPHLYTMYGQKNVRIVQSRDGQDSCWGFVDLTNGDVLKSDGWKKPAKHARGNIRDDHQGMKMITPYGPAYLK